MSGGYTELQLTSNFTFLQGASHPHELVLRAASLGQHSIGITDRNSLAGVVRAHAAAKNAGIRLLAGARLDLIDGPSLLCYPTDRAAYGRLSRLLTLGRRRAPKGECELSWSDVQEHSAGQLFIALLRDPIRPDHEARLADYAAPLRGQLWLAVHNHLSGNQQGAFTRRQRIADKLSLPLIATNDVRYHIPSRRRLCDVLTCIQNGCSLDEAGWRLQKNGERHLKSAKDMAALFPANSDAITATQDFSNRITFSLDELRYEYPDEVVTPGETPQQSLARLTWAGAAERYPQGLPEDVKATLEHELALITSLDYAPYFLTVHDIVRFARAQDILCQGRGSAANSAVCYCLGITSVNPAEFDLLVERFISNERQEPPDIDVDFEHERREEVIQYIYKKYGRDRAGLAATVISYRTKSAVRDVGKTLGLTDDMLDLLAKTASGFREDLDPDFFRAEGFDPDAPWFRMLFDLVTEIRGFPRHLSQHVGGFVISRGPLCEVVPIENAAMEDRTVIQWNKDDLEELGMIKVDVLALGMLSCIRKCFDLIERYYGRSYSLASIPRDDGATYDMLCEADSVGVFQVESRAQMSMLPRLRPRRFYDLVIQVAIVRPGPIQGGMVHPYLRRRSGEETVDYPSEALRKVLEKTLGVPLFQEQAMQIAIVGAGFTPGEADGLRRAMATFKNSGTIQAWRDKFISGMQKNGYDAEFSERCFKQIEGFSDYGFPESHSASFALLAYASAWLKCHYPDVFAAALLNSQPMGFYAPSQLVRDARSHGVDVWPVDINASHWDHGLEFPSGNYYALRLGFRIIKGLRKDHMQQLVKLRGNGYSSPFNLYRRAQLPGFVLERLADADAYGSLGLDRRQAAWNILGQVGKKSTAADLPLFADEDHDWTEESALPAMSEAERMVMDYSYTRLSLNAHPLKFLRAQLDRKAVTPNAGLVTIKDGARATVAGAVLVRQRPGTAKGIIFLTLEDETGVANIVVMPDIFNRYRRILLQSRIVAVRGVVEKVQSVIHIRAREIFSLDDAFDAQLPGPTAKGTGTLSKGRNFH